MTREELCIHACKYAIGELTRKGSCLFITSEHEGREQISWVAVVEWLNALEQEPCEDCISRKAAIDGINEYFHDEYYQRTSIQDCRDCLIEDVIKELPPVTPQPKTGHWIINEDEENAVHGHCSVCGWEAHYYEDDIIGMPYCPNCGAKMVEPQESEE